MDDELDDHAAIIRAWGDRRVPAVDLCRIVVGAQLSIDAECLGELARSVADVARSRSAAPPWPEELAGILREMAHGCLTMIATVAAGLESASPAPLREVQRACGAIGESRARLDRRLAALGDTVGVRTGVDLCLVSHCLLRCAEHTVSTARHLALLRTATSTG